MVTETGASQLLKHVQHTVLWYQRVVSVEGNRPSESLHLPNKSELPA